MTGRRHVEPLQGIGLVAGAQFVEPVGSIGELRFEFDSNFRADFVTTTANRWADGRQQVRGFRAESHVHRADGFCNDALQGAAPTGVDGCDGTLFWIYKKNRDAIGGLDGKEQARTICRGGVTAARLSGGRFEELNDIRVNLPERNERQAVYSESGLKTAAIF